MICLHIVYLQDTGIDDKIYTVSSNEAKRMNGFFNRIQRFMLGRNGFDRYNRFLFVVYIIISILSIFVHSLLYYLFQLSFAGYIIFRTLSKDLYHRTKENMMYYKISSSVKNFFVRQKNKIRDRKTHKYIKCKHCKAKLRVKRRKGKHNVRCPKCREEFSVTIR